MYTPTTEEVRENYGWNGPDSYIKSNREASRAEFDRWLNKVKAEVWDEGAEAEAVASCMNPPCGVCEGCDTPVKNPYKESE